MRLWYSLALCAVLIVSLGVGACYLGRAWHTRITEWLADPQETTVETRPVIVVEAEYPGADARTVADTIAAPIEEQVTGVEHLVSMRSFSGNDGTYRLWVEFESGTNVDMAQVLVQNRVALASPALPVLVVLQGTPTRKMMPQPIAVVNVSSPDGSHDLLYLSNYATTSLKDELYLLAGVGAVEFIGKTTDKMQLVIDPEKLAAYNLSVLDVVKALESQKYHVESSSIGQPPAPASKGVRLAIWTDAPALPQLKELENIVVKGNVIVRDVALIEMGTDSRTCARYNGKPAVSTFLYPLPDFKPNELDAAIWTAVEALRAKAPAGVSIANNFDFTPNLKSGKPPADSEYLLLDVTAPMNASPERIEDILKRCEELLRRIDGVQDVVSLSEHPFDIDRQHPCILLRLTPASGRPWHHEAAQTIRERFRTEMQDAAVRVRDLAAPGSFPACRYPIDLALTGPERDRVDEWGRKLAERLRARSDVTDLWSNGEDSTLRLFVTLDRDRCAALEIDEQKVLDVLKAYTKVSMIGRKIIVRLDDRLRTMPDAILQLQVATAKGQVVRLGTIATVSFGTAPAGIQRLNMYETVEITANPARGHSLEACRTLCQMESDAVRQELNLPDQYRLNWLSDDQAR